MSKLKVGIIGCGGIAFAKHMPSLKEMEDIEMVAFCDIEEERANKAAREFGTPDAKVYTDYNELLKDDTIDNVRVLTWNPTHCEITVAALEAGKHVLCEKPMALTDAEDRRMIETAEKAGKLLTVGYQHRFDADVQYAKRVVDSGELGDVYLAKARVLWQRKFPVWRHLVKEEQGGGAFIDIGTHALDAVLWLTGNYKPKYVCASMWHNFNDRPDCGNVFGTWKKGDIDIEDCGVAFIVMENGMTILLEASYCLNTTEDTNSIQYLLCGTKAGIGNIGETLKMVGDEHNTFYIKEPVLSQGGVSYVSAANGKSVAYCEERTFIDAIQGKANIMVEPHQAAAVAKILEGIYISAETGKPYFFD